MDTTAYEIEQVAACPVCGSTERVPLHIGLTDVVMNAFPGAFDVVKCVACASAYLKSRPAPSALASAYANYPTHNRQPGGGGAVSALGRLRQALTGSYRDIRFRRRAGILRYLLAAPILALPGRRREIDNHGRFLPPRPGRLLDYGCGAGAFLDVARSYGWEVEGVDFDEEVLRVCRADGLHVMSAFDFKPEEHIERYDAITLAHVLEHVTDPTGLLESLHLMLRPGGHLYLEVPNPASIGHRIYGPAWRGWEVPRHFSLPAPQVLRDRLNRIGFEKVRFYSRHAVFGTMSRESRWAEAPTKRSPNERLRRALLKLRARFTSEATEFLTVTGTKAGGAEG